MERNQGAIMKPEEKTLIDNIVLYASVLVFLALLSLPVWGMMACIIKAVIG